MGFDEIIVVSEDDEQNDDMNEMMKCVRARTNRWIQCHSVFTNFGNEIQIFFQSQILESKILKSKILNLKL